MRLSTKKGYTLVELLVYLAIFAFMSIAVINSFIVIMSSFTTTRTNRDLLESGSTAMERISREIRQAESISIPNSTLGSTPGVLELNSTNSGGTSVVIKFAISGTALNIYQDGTVYGNLLGQSVTPTSLVFRRISTTNGEAVKVELTLRDTLSKTNRTENFYDTIILRGGY